MKKILLVVFLTVFLMSVVAHAAKSGLPVYNQTVQSIACSDPSNSDEIVRTACDASGNLSMTVVPKVGGAILNDVVDIPSAGATDRTQLPSNSVTSCMLQSLPGNAGPIYFGGSTVTNSSGTNEGIRLNQNDSTPFMPIDDTDVVYVATDNAGDDVKFLCNQ